MVKLPEKVFKVGPAELRWIFINGDRSLYEIQDRPNYEYKATAALTKDKAQPYIDQLNAFWLKYNKGKIVKAKSLGYKVEEDEAGYPTGLVTFTFVINTSFKMKDGTEEPTVVKVFEEKGTDITDIFHASEKKAGPGSVGVIHGFMKIYDNDTENRGIKLYLSAIQFTRFIDFYIQETSK